VEEQWRHTPVFEDIQVNKPLGRIQTLCARHSECKFSFWFQLKFEPWEH